MSRAALSGLLLSVGQLSAPAWVALAVLAAGGWLTGFAAMLAALFVAAATLPFAGQRRRAQARALAAVRAAAAGQAGDDADPLGGEIGRTIRQMDQSRGLLAQRLHTEESIMGSLPDPLIVLGADYAVLRANAAAHAAFGAEMPAVLRHPVLRAAIERSLREGTPLAVDLTVPVPVPRDVHATVYRLFGGPVACVLSDRTRERALERMRADFVANASHELRTPLAGLIGFIDTLRGPAADDPPAQARFLQIMAEQAARMNRLIDDLLSLSRIELTEHQRPTEPVNLPDLLQHMADSFEARILQRKITLDLDVPDDLPIVPGDEDQLGQVFQNLLDNAVKYGREGGAVRLRAAAMPPGGRWPARPGVTVAVSDDGAGIAREHLPRLTERFYRVDKGRSRAVGGTGLGLAIVKHIVNRHRGQFAIESREGEGATFTVWLPASEPAQGG